MIIGFCQNLKKVFEGWRDFHMWLRNMREAFRLKYGVIKQVHTVQSNRRVLTNCNHNQQYEEAAKRRHENYVFLLSMQARMGAA